MFAKKSNGAIIFTLVLTVAAWGASNAGTKYLVGDWPPVWVGSTRLFCAGLILLAILKWTTWLGQWTPLPAAARRAFWLRGALTLAIYLVAFNLAIRLTTASHVALYLGTAPVWTLLMEERPAWTMRSAQRYGAATLALAGVVVLCWPSLKSGSTGWAGELLGLSASVLWALYGKQCRDLSVSLSGAEVSAHTMWRAGFLLLPIALIEIFRLGPSHNGDFVLAHAYFWKPGLVWTQVYCFVGGGVVAYALWNNALRQWPTSKVFLFNNLIPLSTMSWSHLLLGEVITPTFWLAMLLIVTGVVIGQARLQPALRINTLSPE